MPYNARGGLKAIVGLAAVCAVILLFASRPLALVQYLDGVTGTPVSYLPLVIAPPAATVTARLLYALGDLLP